MAETEIKSINGRAICDETARDRIETRTVITEQKTIVPTASQIIEDYFVLANGNLAYTKGYNTTELIPIDFTAGTNVKTKGCIYGSLALVVYDKSQSPVLVISANNASDFGITPMLDNQEINFTMPENGAYIRCSVNTMYSVTDDLYNISGVCIKTVIEKINELEVEDNKLKSIFGLEDDSLITITAKDDDVIANHFVTAKGEVASTQNYVCTELIPIDFYTGAVVQVKTVLYGACGFCVYDKNLTVIFGIDGLKASDYGYLSKQEAQLVSFELPKGARYIRLSGMLPNYQQPSDLYVIGPEMKTPLNTIDDLTDTVEANITDFTQKKVLVIGDSISADYYGQYPKWVTHLINTGFFSLSNTVNSSIHATGFVARYLAENPNAENDFIHRIEAIENKNTYDFVIVFGGINDFIQSVPMGENGGDKTQYFKPAVDYFFDYLVNNFTQARIAVLSPLRTYNPHANQEGNKQEVYADYIKEVAKSYCLPVLNLTEESGFCPFIETFKHKWTYTGWGGDGATGDGVHPSEEYERKFLAPMIRNFLQGLM